MRFVVGDACTLDAPDDSFDVVRSERTLQWLTNPEAAVAEMTRVLRPGGLVSLVDTDWSTFEIDVGDDDLATRVREAMRTERGRPSNIGRRLADLVQDFGCELKAQTTATQNWNAWDPDESPAPEGCFSMSTSPMTSSTLATSRLVTGTGSCPPSTQQRVTAASPWPSRCSPLWRQRQRPLSDGTEARARTVRGGRHEAARSGAGTSRTISPHLIYRLGSDCGRPNDGSAVVEAGHRADLVAGEGEVDEADPVWLPVGVRR